MRIESEHEMMKKRTDHGDGYRGHPVGGMGGGGSALGVLRAAILSMLMLALPARAGNEDKFVGLWVTRWDYRTPADVRDVIERAASAGFTDVVWQARGQADAYYQSDLSLGVTRS
jgi:hypothetical protein